MTHIVNFLASLTWHVNFLASLTWHVNSSTTETIHHYAAFNDAASFYLANELLSECGARLLTPDYLQRDLIVAYFVTSQSPK